MKNRSVFSAICFGLLCGAPESPVFAEQASRNATAGTTSIGVALLSEHAATREKAARRPLSARGLSDQSWGIAAAGRLATVPFATSDDTTVGSFVPLLFFENDFAFLRGTEGGFYLLKSPKIPVQVSALSRLRFVDLPAEDRNALAEDSIDFGLQLRYSLTPSANLDLEVMTDRDARLHANLRLDKGYVFGSWQLSPNATVRYKDAEFNTAYYAIEALYGESIGDGIDFSVGLDARYHMVSNLYLLGAVQARRLDHQAYRSRAVEDRYESNILLGFGFFENQSKAKRSVEEGSRYLRIAHGWATPSNIGEIVGLQTEEDPYHHHLTSLFYGHPLAKDLLSRPLDIYLTPGIAYHHSSSQQQSSIEYVAAIKAYYTFEWPTQWRFGIAEGLSYIDEVSYIEASEIARKDYKPSRLMNYLDFSFDLNIGELFNRGQWRHVWAGYALHHRSAIFEQSSQYGRIKGGSNYNTLYLQFDF